MATMPPPHALLHLLIIAVCVVSAAHAIAGADSMASARREAELAFHNVLKEGTAVSAEMDKALATPKEPGNVPCLEEVQKYVRDYVTEVAKAAPEKDFNGARDLFNKMLYYPTGMYSCSYVKEPVIAKALTYEANLQTTSDLFNKASPPPPPPAEE